MDRKLEEALNEISDAHIAEAAGRGRKRRPHRLGAVAAVLAVVALAAVLLIPGANTETSPPATGTSTGTAPGVVLLAAPQYPEMASYPDEAAFLNQTTGEFDSDGFSQVFGAWWEDQQRQRSQPQGYADGLEEYCLACVPEFLSGSGGENAVCSPLNVYMALSLLAEACGGESRQQILSLLGADSLQSLREQAGCVWNAHYCADGASASVLANSLWLDEDLNYNNATIQALADSYYASVFRGELGSDAVNEPLQNWLNEQTGGLLAEQVKGVELTPETVLALASTIYYRARWSEEFSESFNTEGLFHSPPGDKTVTYMNQTLLHGPYYWGEDYGAVYLNLEDGGKMWLILPDEGLTPEDLLASGNALSMIFETDGITEDQKSVKVNLSLPKFDVSADTDLCENLRELGITEVFSEEADFSPILPGADCILTAVKHAARVKIDEEGLEAAAYTVMLAYGAAAPPKDEIDFVLDRPFLFLVTSQDNLPLFAGVVNQP